ncbi:MAG: tetratricopeptide repeat protein [Acidobacteriota bacterium]|nr:tetratricopeptide repeat protein [Acidobacteriota bacterium]
MAKASSSRPSAVRTPAIFCCFAAYRSGYRVSPPRRRSIAKSAYASSLGNLKRFEEAKRLLRRTMPVARRVLGEGHSITLKMRKIYAMALFKDYAATLDDLREAVTTVEETARTARRVMGGAHPLARDIERTLQNAREALAARDEA